MSAVTKSLAVFSFGAGSLAAYLYFELHDVPHWKDWPLLLPTIWAGRYLGKREAEEIR